MTGILRGIAIAIAVAAIVDPVIARRTPVPLPLDVLMPRPSDPEYPRAQALRARLRSALDGVAVVDGADEPAAFVAFGRARLPPAADRPLFSVPLHARPSVTIHAVQAPPVIPGQTAPVVAVVRGLGLQGRTTSIALERRGAAVSTLEHEWKSDDEEFEARFAFVPEGAGVHRVRLTATTRDVDGPATADLAVVARDRRLRVLVYDPRPTWPVTFVRRSLEGDPLFDVSATVRTTSRTATTSAGAPQTLASLQPDRFDAIIAGAPEALTAADMRALEIFVSRRGGTLILLPDRRVPEPVRRHFGLPAFDEALLERPLTIEPPQPSLRASELLLAPRRVSGFEPLALVRQGEHTRAVVAQVLSGEGRIIVSGALDAWRYRADPEASFDMFWRSLIADAAATTVPRLAVAVEPSLARPGDEVVVSARVRATEFTGGAASIQVPPISGRLLSSAGSGKPIRLWPAAAAGTFTARITAPHPGEYAVSVSAAGASIDAPLVVADDVVHAMPPASRAAAFAAAASGGAVAAGIDDLAPRVRALNAAEVVRATRPMRSAWWILPVTAVLCTEWAVRRRRGLR